LSSSIGHAFLLRGIPLLVAGVVAGLVLVGLRRLRGTGVGLLAAATLAAMLGDVLKGHAAASTSWTWLHVGEQWVHIAAAGVWIGGPAGRLRRTGGAELVAMATVLAATALLQNLAPARTAAAAGATTLSPVVIDASDFATTYRLHLTVTSDTPGFNTFTLTVSDYETRK